MGSPMSMIGEGSIQHRTISANPSLALSTAINHNHRQEIVNDAVLLEFVILVDLHLQ